MHHRARDKGNLHLLDFLIPHQYLAIAVEIEVAIITGYGRHGFALDEIDFNRPRQVTFYNGGFNAQILHEVLLHHVRLHFQEGIALLNLCDGDNIVFRQIHCPLHLDISQCKDRRIDENGGDDTANDEIEKSLSNAPSAPLRELRSTFCLGRHAFSSFTAH